MRTSTPLAVALTFAVPITVGLHSPADQPRASGTGSVGQRAITADAIEQFGGISSPAAADGARRSSGPRVRPSRYAFFPPNRRSRIAVSWDRDIPVTYLIAKSNARPHMFATIVEAFRRADVQTGIQFRYGGRAATSEPVGTPDQPVVIVDFGTVRNHPRLASYHGGVYAVGGPLLITNGERDVFIGGQVTIDVTTTRGIGTGFRDARLGATLLHEIGHVLGLAHVTAPRQMMAPANIRADINGWFHAGDLRGLRRLIHD